MSPQPAKGSAGPRCAVVGASGYSGAELVSLLARHPSARLVSIHADTSAGQRFDALHPSRRGHGAPAVVEPFVPEKLAGLDVVFLALPHGASAAAAAALVGKVGHVIDLSGDLRLPDAAAYRRWYGLDHPAPALLGRAVYGLPELFGRELTGARLVACAGCYATASQLAAAPALSAGSGADVVISAMSGTSGAGRKADLALSFSEVSSNLRAYRVGRHQHAPEIAAGLARRTGRDVRVTFVPHLVPIVRGILATVVVRNDAGLTQARALETFAAFYEGRAFVSVVDPQRPPEVADVVHSNRCDLTPIVDEEAGTIVVVAALDNLGKGAAGQAVQVMNLVLGQPETAGLTGAGK